MLFTSDLYADILLPLSVPRPYTYQIPTELMDLVQFGGRVEVQLRDTRLYAGIVVNIHKNKPAYDTKPILSVIDEQPIINEKQYRFWEWLAQYYSCTLGEVMIAALPAQLKLTSETRISLSPIIDESQIDLLSDKEYLVYEALTLQAELSIDDIRKILNQKTVYPLINQMMALGILQLEETLQEKHKPKMVASVRLLLQHEALAAEFELVKKSDKQTAALLALIQLSQKNGFHIWLKASEVNTKAQTYSSVLKALEKKGIVEMAEREVSRIGRYDDDLEDAQALTDAQIAVLSELETLFKTKKTVLLHGVTGSGKTRIYTELAQKTIAEGKQVLYLLPEITLTTQIVNRLQRIFGNDISVYHSRVPNSERVELWRAALGGKAMIMGARSSLLLPFKELGLIIVDEEHDQSYKQQDPNPRYNARDAAIYLAQVHGAKILLGTATPSVETYQNALTDKFGLVELPERIGKSLLPTIEMIDVRSEMKAKTMQSNFSKRLLDEIKETIDRGEQVILFQNRRGYSPTLQCTTCGWTAECKNCDVTLTYHKFSNSLNCHYCNYHKTLPTECPACTSKILNIKGFGTERIEDELKVYLPEVRIARMDLDAVRSRSAHSKIIADVEEQRIDILIGTQMVTKGLDFDNVTLVGVLSADNLLRFPDFRATERAFQLLTQVAGRAGRKEKAGKVLIQTYDPTLKVLQQVKKNDYQGFFLKELQERKQFLYPPFYRLIAVRLRHKKPETLRDGARFFTHTLKKALGERVNGPAVPQVERVNTYYQLDYLIKMERDPTRIQFAKNTIAEATHQMQQTEGYSTVRVSVDVDPY